MDGPDHFTGKGSADIVDLAGKVTKNVILRHLRSHPHGGGTALSEPWASFRPHCEQFQGNCNAVTETMPITPANTAFRASVYDSGIIGCLTNRRRFSIAAFSQSNGEEMYARRKTIYALRQDWVPLASG